MDLSTRVAALIRHQGKALLSPQDSKATIALLGAVLLDLMDMNAIRLEPVDAVQRAAILKREVPLPEHLAIFHGELGEERVSGFIDAWTQSELDRNRAAAKLLTERTEAPEVRDRIREELTELQEHRCEDPRLVDLLVQSDLVGALLIPPVLEAMMPGIEAWREREEQQAQLIEALPLLWVMRYVQ